MYLGEHRICLEQASVVQDTVRCDAMAVSEVSAIKSVAGVIFFR